MIEAFGDRATPRYLIRDRDGVYGTEVRRRLHVKKSTDTIPPGAGPQVGFSASEETWL
jgi:hypothetical protein